jgi:hypothetical protein
MKKTIHCCDVCGKLLENYNPLKDELCVKLPSVKGSDEKYRLEKKDVCLSCLIFSLNVSLNVDITFEQGTNFLSLLEHRADKYSKKNGCKTDEEISNL